MHPYTRDIDSAVGTGTRRQAVAGPDPTRRAVARRTQRLPRRPKHWQFPLNHYTRIVDRPTPIRAIRLATATAVAIIGALILAACSTEAAQDTGTDPTQPANAAIQTTPIIVRPAPVEGSIETMMNEPIAPFTNIAPAVLGDDFLIENRHPGVAIFDYDRDGDMDFYVSSAEINALLPDTTGGPNKLFRNDGNNRYTQVAEAAGVDAPEANSTGVAACDIDNDGYQDLYVASYGRIGDGLDYRAARYYPELPDIIKDRLFRNNQDGTFTDITEEAFGDAANIRSAFSVACADVDNDGLIDIFVCNRIDQDFLWFDRPDHHGHYNVLYHNNGDGTFSDITQSAGLIYGPILMRDPFGEPIAWPDPITGESIPGYNPDLIDASGERVGEPTSQTLAALFFDHDDDGDDDLWLADDGSRMKVFRNDTVPGEIKFTQISREMGVDKMGAWMGFALGDYDSDLDMDIFVTNIGFHPLTREAPLTPSGDCAYGHRYGWGTCFHYLLRNEGTRELDGIGTVGIFNDVASATHVAPSQIMPPTSLDPSEIRSDWQVPTGLAAYDFGFGAAFFDVENDGDQDLYWLGAMSDRGEGPSGHLFPGAGRMLRGNGNGEFQDITVESRLLDIIGVDYSMLETEGDDLNPAAARISAAYHENGKGLAKGDLNGDGYVDLIGTNSNGCRLVSQDECSWDAGPLFMWMNAGGDSNWVTLRLIGGRAVSDTGSNADGIGAKVFVEASNAEGRVTSQVQHLLGSSTFLSMNSLELTYGLGDATQVDRITIKWPSGLNQVIESVGINQSVTITEGQPLN